MVYIIEVVVCVFATTIGAVCGVGGGVIMKPVLDACGIMSVEQVSFLSGCTVLAMTCVSVLRQGKGSLTKTTCALAAGGAIGGVLGKNIFQRMVLFFGSGRIAGKWQAIILFVFLLLTFFYMMAEGRIRTYHVKGIMPSLLIGGLLGGVSAFLGIGGGPMNLMVLYFFYSMETKEAVQNSLFIIFTSQLCSLATSIATKSVPIFPWLTLLIMVACGILGARIGRRIHKRLTGHGIQILLDLTILLILGICLYNMWSLW